MSGFAQSSSGCRASRGRARPRPAVEQQLEVLLAVGGRGAAPARAAGPRPGPTQAITQANRPIRCARSVEHASSVHGVLIGTSTLGSGARRGRQPAGRTGLHPWFDVHAAVRSYPRCMGDAQTAAAGRRPGRRRLLLALGAAGAAPLAQPAGLGVAASLLEAAGGAAAGRRRRCPLLLGRRRPSSLLVMPWSGRRSTTRPRRSCSWSWRATRWRRWIAGPARAARDRL